MCFIGKQLTEFVVSVEVQRGRTAQWLVFHEKRLGQQTGEKTSKYGPEIYCKNHTFRGLAAAAAVTGLA